METLIERVFTALQRLFVRWKILVGDSSDLREHLLVASSNPTILKANSHSNVSVSISEIGHSKHINLSGIQLRRSFLGVQIYITVFIIWSKIQKHRYGRYLYCPDMSIISHA